jgi:hypothetical protein
MLAPSRKVLDDAGVTYTTHWKVGAIAETIVEQAKRLDSSMIYMGHAWNDGPFERAAGFQYDQGSAHDAHSRSYWCTEGARDPSASLSSWT